MRESSTLISRGGRALATILAVMVASVGAATAEKRVALVVGNVARAAFARVESGGLPETGVI